MIEMYAEQPAAQRARILETLLGEVDGLLAVSLEVPLTPIDDFERLIDNLAHALGSAIRAPDYRYGASQTRDLVAALTLDGERPERGFLWDLAEILFLPREQRSEYTTNPHATAPYRVRKLLLEYAVFGRQMDEVVGAVSKSYCAQRCDKPPVGCCHILGYDLGLVPEVMLELQRLEAVRNGWQPPPTEDHCRYHTPTGCVLAMFKSPACVGFLCEPLTAHLRVTRGGPELDCFLRRVSEFNNCDLDRRKIFHAMAATIESGRALLAAG